MFNRSLVLLAATLAVQAAAAADDAANTIYAIDPAKSTLGFTFTQSDTQNKGKFGKFDVVLEMAPDASAVNSLNVTVNAASLNTADKSRDDQLKSRDFFDVKNYPEATFAATQITKTDTGYEAVGQLTIRGNTHDAVVPFTLRTVTERGKNVGYLSGKTSIQRLDYGLGATGDWKSTKWVGNEVTISYEVKLIEKKK